MDVKDVEYRAR